MLLIIICALTILIVNVTRFVYLKYVDLTNPYFEVIHNFFVAFTFGMCGLSIHLLHDNFPTKYLLLVMFSVFIVIFVNDIFIKNIYLNKNNF